jgi:hypothetical protein
MRKLICLVGIGSLFVSMVLIGCASMTTGQKTVITQSNLSILKGTWQGWTTFSSYLDKPVQTTVEINNDAVPLKGRITLTNLPDRAAALFPADAKTAGNNVIINFNNGRISDQGTLIGTTGENFLELTLYSGEKMRMIGWFYYYGARGTMELNKK